MTVVGTMGIREWDEGCMITLGAERTPYVVDGETRYLYTVDLTADIDSGLREFGGKIPCYFQEPEEVYQPYRVPAFVFKRNDMTPAFDRHAWYQFVARAPAKGATKITLPDGRVGYDRYDNQWRATQFDMAYDCIVNARRQQESLIMLQYALKHFIPPWFVFKVVDSLGDVREYDAGEMSVSNQSELADIADRTIAWGITFTVRGEVDLHADRTYPAAQAVDLTIDKLPLG